MKGEAIFCFSKEWSADPTSNTHVMRELARDNKVVWLNSVASRNPNFSSGRDWRKLFGKLRMLFARAENVEGELWVCTPVVAPFPYSRLAHWINRWLLAWLFWRLKRQLGIKDFQLWTFLPTAEPYIGQMGEKLSVYYCIDQWAEFSEVNADATVVMERNLCTKADLIFATAASLVEPRKALNPNTFLARHGVDHPHFAAARTQPPEPPADARNLTKPIIGFFGLIHDWVDQDLLIAVARQRRNWTILLIGQANVDTSEMAKEPNIILVGRKPYSALPAYCAAFDVGIIPFKVNELTRHVNPIKLREYLSAGVPAVSTPLDEVSHYGDLVAVASGADDFVSACEEAIALDDQQRDALCESMADETWRAVVERVGATVVSFTDGSRNPQ